MSPIKASLKMLGSPWFITISCFKKYNKTFITDNWFLYEIKNIIYKNSFIAKRYKQYKHPFQNCG